MSNFFDFLPVPPGELHVLRCSYTYARLCACMVVCLRAHMRICDDSCDRVCQCRLHPYTKQRHTHTQTHTPTKKESIYACIKICGNKFERV